MLLSRVADSLYWIGRYLERAEHAARVTGVAVDLSLGRATHAGNAATTRLYSSLGMKAIETAPHLSLADEVFFDSTENSVVSCITTARENARQVREEISTAMWEQLNALYLRLRQMRDDAAWTGRTHYLTRTVIDGIHLFQGITDATMGHGESWHYLRIGRFLERAGTTSALLNRFLAEGPLDQADWVGLLRSCSALEAYCRHYTADVRSDRVAEFLLLNAEFPRSVHFAAGEVESGLLALARINGRRAGGQAERLAGRLHAALDYGQVDEILGANPHAYLAEIGSQCAQIHAALYQTCITYPIDEALPA